MKMTNKYPQHWRDLQDLSAEFLREAGYDAISPYEIETVRGKVEVDIYVEAPHELAKKIICECKYWDTPVPKEKVHAFRTVVNDSGSTLGIMISKAGYQSGALEASKCSNVMLLTWEEFLSLIYDKWIINRLHLLKQIDGPLSVYSDPYDVPLDELSIDDFEIYKRKGAESIALHKTCFIITKSILQSDNTNDLYRCSEFDNIDDYLAMLTHTIQAHIEFYKELFKATSLESWKFDNFEYMNINLIDTIIE